MTIVNAAGRAMTDVTDDSQLCDVTDDQKPPGTRSYLTVGLPDPHPDLVLVLAACYSLAKGALVYVPNLMCGKAREPSSTCSY